MLSDCSYFMLETVRLALAGDSHAMGGMALYVQYLLY